MGLQTDSGYVESGQIDPGLRHQCDESGDEVQRLDDDVGGSISVRRLELVTHVAMGRERQPLFRHRRPSNVAAQTFQLVAFIGPGRDPRLASENPATLPTESSNGSLQLGRVCSVNTLRP